MAKFGEITEFWSPGLTIPVFGKEYVIPLPGPKLGLWCQIIADHAPELHFAATTEEIAAALNKLEGLPELEGNLVLAQRVLGTVHAEMVADDVPHHYVKACADTAFIWIILGEDKAREFYEAGGRFPERAARENRATRRAAAGRTSTAAVPETLTAASTSGTTSRTRSSRKGQAKGSRGATS